MDTQERWHRNVEIYKCIALTVIALILYQIQERTPVPITLRSIQSEAVSPQDIPVVRVQGGSIAVANTVDVDVGNTVQVQGAVSIEQ